MTLPMATMSWPSSAAGRIPSGVRSSGRCARGCRDAVIGRAVERVGIGVGRWHGELDIRAIPVFRLAVDQIKQCVHGAAGADPVGDIALGRKAWRDRASAPSPDEMRCVECAGSIASNASRSAVSAHLHTADSVADEQECRDWDTASVHGRSRPFRLGRLIDRARRSDGSRFVRRGHRPEPAVSSWDTFLAGAVRHTLLLGGRRTTDPGR